MTWEVTAVGKRSIYMTYLLPGQTPLTFGLY